MKKIKFEIPFILNITKIEYRIIIYISAFIDRDKSFTKQPFLLKLFIMHLIEKKKKYLKSKKINMLIYVFK